MEAAPTYGTVAPPPIHMDAPSSDVAGIPAPPPEPFDPMEQDPHSIIWRALTRIAVTTCLAMAE